METSRPGGSGASLTGDELPARAGSGPAGLRSAPAPGLLQRVHQKVLQGAVVISTLLLLLWAAAFIYAAFYYSFMPKAAYSTPVHYYYRWSTHIPSTESTSALLSSHVPDKQRNRKDVSHYPTVKEIKCTGPQLKTRQFLALKGQVWYFEH